MKSLLVACLALFLASTAFAADAAKVRVYVGTYTGAKSKGIYLFDLDPASGKLTPQGVVAEMKNPTFLAIAPDQKHLYAVGEFSGFGGGKGGAVAAYSIDAASGKLTLLNEQSSGGAGPCHVSVDPSGKTVMVANYTGGSVASLPIQADGKLGEAKSFIQHTGSSADPRRQKEPHAHSINPDAAGKFAFAADLGLDKVLVYKLDAAKGTLTPNDPPFASVAPGSGPRHFSFHPSGKYAYAINELANTITAFSYDASKGALKEVQVITTLPEGFKGNSYTAEVVVHPSGKFLYGSNRGHNSIAIFAIDEATGKLTAKGHQAEKISEPRNFAIDPTGQNMLVGNQRSDSIAVFKIEKDGSLKPTGQTAEVGAPVCLRFLAVK